MAGESTQKLTWSSRTTFLLAAVGASVGLGNFWRFPYEAGENGGGAFVIVYLGCVLLVAMPLVVCELLIGRRGGLSAAASARKVAIDEGRSGLWAIVGWTGMVAVCMLLSFYSVIAGWVIAYLPKMAMLSTQTLAVAGETVVTSGEAIVDRTALTGAMFNDLLVDWRAQLWGHTIFMSLTVAIVYNGLHSGIEKAIEILMPTFFLMLFLLAGYALMIGDASAGLRFLFMPDFSKITPDVMINALGHSFFSIGVGSAILITYGAYLQKDVKIGQSAVIISLADTLIAITAGVLIFPLVFEFGLDPAGGPGLLFVTLPIAFAGMQWGNVIGTLFFSLALVAALTSSISMLEIFVRYSEDKGLSRHKAAILSGVAIWTLGLTTVFSTTYLKDVKLLDKNPFDFFDFMTGSVLLPLAGLLAAVFVGWFLSRETVRDELAMTDGQFSLWLFVTRYIAPVAVIGILLLKLGVIGG